MLKRKGVTTHTSVLHARKDGKKENISSDTGEVSMIKEIPRATERQKKVMADSCCVAGVREAFLRNKTNRKPDI